MTRIVSNDMDRFITQVLIKRRGCVWTNGKGEYCFAWHGRGGKRFGAYSECGTVRAYLAMDPRSLAAFKVAINARH